MAVVRERLVDDRRELGRHAGDELAQRLRRPLDRGPHHRIAAVLRIMRRPPREQVVERRAERVDVAALVDRLAAQLLGRHESRRAEHDAGAGLDRITVGHRRGDARDAYLAAGRIVGLADHLREPPVDHHGLAELARQDVRRLDVAVDDPALVRVGDRVRGGDDVRQQREPCGQLRGAADQLLERPAADLAHHVERRTALGRAGVMDRDDRRVLEPRGDPGLAGEPAYHVGVERQRPP